MTWEIRQGDALESLREIPDESAQCCVTSPPYFGLRDYGVDGQIGLEETLDVYIARLVEVFAEVRRVLRSDGTLWLNIGDSYVSKPRGSDNGWDKSRLSNPARVQKAQSASLRRSRHLATSAGAKFKDLMMVPAVLALALRDDGWWLRSEIIWHKPTPMPESVRDRPTRSHEQIFLFAKSARYLYDADAIREPDKGKDHTRNDLRPPEPSGGLLKPHRGLRKPEGRNGTGANKRSVWTVHSGSYPAAHFATFPPRLIEPCVLAGSAARACSECGAPWRRRVVSRENHGFEPTCDHPDGGARSVVLDPFCGAATTGLVATRLERDFIGIELNHEYVELGRRRILDDAPLLNTGAEVAV